MNDECAKREAEANVVECVRLFCFGGGQNCGGDGELEGRGHVVSDGKCGRVEDGVVWNLLLLLLREGVDFEIVDVDVTWFDGGKPGNMSQVLAIRLAWAVR